MKHKKLITFVSSIFLNIAPEPNNRLRKPQKKQLQMIQRCKPCRRQMFYQSACWLYSEPLKLPFYSRYKISPRAYGPSTHPHSMAYKYNQINKSRILNNPKLLNNAPSSDWKLACNAQEPEHWHPCLFSFFVLEFESADRNSRTDLSLDRGVCDGDSDTIPPLLCVESIALSYWESLTLFSNR